MQDDPLFGFLLAGNAQSRGAVGLKVEEPSFPPQECANTLTNLFVSSQHGTVVHYEAADELFSGLVRAVVYQPNTLVSAFVDEMTCGTYRTFTAVSSLRRKIVDFAQLTPNWDGEGAEPVERETIITGLQLIEHIAIVLERKNTNSVPSVRAFPDGSIFFKWIRGQKELAITVQGRNVEVQRWEPLDAFQSQGLWQISVDATSEHVEWVLT